MFALGRRDEWATRAGGSAAGGLLVPKLLRPLALRLSGRGERGAVAVEAALVLSFFMVPFMLGLFQYGNYFWQAQRVQTYAPRFPTGTITGSLSCSELLAQVKTTVASLGDDLGAMTPIPTSAITVVAEALPTVGVVINVSVQVPILSGLGSLVPLPGTGAVTSEFSQRLDDVVLTSGSVCR